MSKGLLSPPHVGFPEEPVQRELDLICSAMVGVPHRHLLPSLPTRMGQGCSARGVPSLLRNRQSGTAALFCQNSAAVRLE